MPQSKPMGWVFLFFYMIVLFLLISVFPLSLVNSVNMLGKSAGVKLFWEW